MKTFFQMYQGYFVASPVKNQINEPCDQPKDLNRFKKRGKLSDAIVKLWFSAMNRIFIKRFYKIDMNLYFQSLNFDFLGQGSGTES